MGCIFILLLCCAILQNACGMFLYNTTVLCQSLFNVELTTGYAELKLILYII